MMPTYTRITTRNTSYPQHYLQHFNPNSRLARFVANRSVTNAFIVLEDNLNPN